MVDVLRAWAQHVERPARIVPVPVPLAVRFDDRAAQRELGFRPRPIEEGIAATARWFEARVGTGLDHHS